MMMMMMAMMVMQAVLDFNPFLEVTCCEKLGLHLTFTLDGNVAQQLVRYLLDGMCPNSHSSPPKLDSTQPKSIKSLNETLYL